MDFQILAYPAVAMVLITSLVELLSRNWRISLISLALQYLGVFMLVGLHWSLERSAVKLVAGFMASAVLGIAAGETALATNDGLLKAEFSWPSGRVFRTLAATLIWLTVLSLAPRTASWIPGIPLTHAWGSLTLIGMGLLHLSLTSQPLRVIIGLLTILSGFEILYAAVESSALLAGLLAASHMGLSLIGAYLLSAPTADNAT